MQKSSQTEGRDYWDHDEMLDYFAAIRRWKQLGKRGRPFTGKAMSAAERVRRYRERKKHDAK
jgi:hypothetical protein